MALFLAVASFFGVQWGQSSTGKTLQLKEPALPRPAEVNLPVLAAKADKEQTRPDRQPRIIPQAEEVSGAPAQSSLLGDAPPDKTTAAAGATNNKEFARVAATAKPEPLKTSPEPPTVRKPETNEASMEKPAPITEIVPKGFEPGAGHSPPNHRLAALHTRRSQPNPLRRESLAAQNAAKSAAMDDSGSPAGTQELFYNKARAYHRSGRLTAAIRLYRQVRELNPDHFEALLNLSGAYLQTGNYGKALEILEQLEQAAPRPKGVLLNLAVARIGLGSPHRALTELDRAEAQSDATTREIRFHQAVAHAGMGRFETALELYRQVERERPDDFRLQFNLAATCDTLGLYPEALSHYQAALQLFPETAAADRQTVMGRIRTLRQHLAAAPTNTQGK
jgi:Flp pilus assembly protein TadD